MSPLYELFYPDTGLVSTKTEFQKGILAPHVHLPC